MPLTILMTASTKPSRSNFVITPQFGFPLKNHAYNPFFSPKNMDFGPKWANRKGNTSGFWLSGVTLERGSVQGIPWSDCYITLEPQR